MHIILHIIYYLSYRSVFYYECSQNQTRSKLEQSDERILNLSTPVPTVVVINAVASGRDTPAVTVAILPRLQIFVA